MIYTAAFTQDLTVATMDDYIEAIKAMVCGKFKEFLDMPIVNSRYCFVSNNEYPETSRYYFVGKVVTVEPTSDTLPGDVTLWFKKQHPLYKEQYAYVGIRILKNYYYGTSITPWCISIDCAENYLNGVLINHVKGFNPADFFGTTKPNEGQFNYKWSDGNSGGYYGSVLRGGFPMPLATLPTTKAQRSATITFLLGDWGFGIFGAASRKPEINSISNLLGVLFVETLAKDLTSKNENAFVPENYPMFVMVGVKDMGSQSNPTLYNGGGDTKNIVTDMVRNITMLRAPGEDATLSDTPMRMSSCLAYNIGNGAILDAQHVYRNADGEECAEMYPVFLRARNTLLAKLPLMKPIVGSHRYVHMNKRLVDGEKVYHGITATHLGISHFNPELTNDNYVKLREAGINHEYIRLK